MERVLLIDELRDEIFRYTDMASLVSLDRVSGSTRQAVRSFTYPRRVVMRSFRHVVVEDQDAEAAEHEADRSWVAIPSLVGCGTSDLFQCGPRVEFLHLDLSGDYLNIHCRPNSGLRHLQNRCCPPAVIVYEIVNLFADQLSDLMITIGTNKFTRRKECDHDATERS